MSPLEMQDPAGYATATESFSHACSAREALLTGEARPSLRTTLRATLLSQQALAYGLVAVWIQFLLPRSIDDPDLWWHLRNAALQLQLHAFLRSDVYSFTALNASWINHEWLAELAYWLGWRVAGARGILFVTGSAIEVIFMGVYWLAYRKSGSWPCATLVTLAASLLATVSFGPRTLLFGWICLVSELVLLELSAEKPWLALALPPLFLIWINLHGSWLIGMIVLVVFLGCGLIRVDHGSIRSPRLHSKQLRLLTLAFALSIGSLFINPYGWHLIAYPFDLAFHQVLNVKHVEEWQPLDLQSPCGVIFLAFLMLLFVAQIFTPQRRQRSWTLGELALVAIGIYSACRHSRFLFLAAILVMPAIGRHLAAALASDPSRFQNPARDPMHSRTHLLLDAALLITTVVLCQAQIVRNVRHGSAANQHFPQAALPFLENFHPQGAMFNECLWGGYIAYYVPNLPVFIDSRFDIFERNGTLKDYLDIIGLKDSIALLDKRHIRYVLFERDTPLVYLLQQTHQWRPLYDDGYTVMLEHSAALQDASVQAAAR